MTAQNSHSSSSLLPFPQVKTLEVEISTRQPSLEAALRMVEAGDEASEAKLEALRARHAAVAEKVADRLTVTSGLADRLHALGRSQRQMTDWIGRATDALEARNYMPLDEERYLARLEAAKKEKEEHKTKMEALMSAMNELKAEVKLFFNLLISSVAVQ